MITGLQIRAARAALRWSAQELATRVGVSLRSIQRFELADGIPPARAATLQDIQLAFEAAGIEFVGTPNDRPGIRAGLRPSNASSQPSLI